jgi:hypothetical protein
VLLSCLGKTQQETDSGDLPFHSTYAMVAARQPGSPGVFFVFDVRYLMWARVCSEKLKKNTKKIAMNYGHINGMGANVRPCVVVFNGYFVI